MPNSAIADRPTLSSPTGQSQDSPDWRTFSKELEQLAIKLLSLTPVVDEDSRRDRETAIRKLLRSTNGLRRRLHRFETKFSSVGTVGDVVRVGNRSYASAHHAALGEAHLLLESLLQLPLQYKKLRVRCAGVCSDFGEYPAFKPTNSWCLAFQDVPARIGRERAALESAESQQALQASTPSLHVAANQPGASNETANRQPPQPPLSILPDVNLELNQIRFGGKCYDVTSDGALLVDGIVKAHPDWFVAYKVFSKPSEIKKHLPDPIKELIEADSGKGQRLKLSSAGSAGSPAQKL